jgi:paraquat-inducible protein B
VFINAPFDSYVTGEARFWQASGIDMSINSDGVKLRTESLTAILEGGVAFQYPARRAAAPAAVDTSFTLYNDEERAMRPLETEIRTSSCTSRDRCAACRSGAPVELHGIAIGEVKSLDVEYDKDLGTLHYPVEVDLYPQRIRGRKAQGAAGAAARMRPKPPAAR